MKTCFEFSQEENVEVNSVSVLLYLVAPRSLDEYKLEVTDRQAEAMRKTKKKSIKQLYDRDHANIRKHMKYEQQEQCFCASIQITLRLSIINSYPPEVPFQC